MTWTQRPLLAFDTETTGVDTSSDRIVQAALVRRGPDGDTVRVWLIDPGVEIPSSATAIHGITTEHAREQGKDAATALDEVACELADALADGVPVVAFNASFDLAVLEADLGRHGLPSLASRAGGLKPIVDPLVLDRGVDRYRKGRRTLGDLCAVYGVACDGDFHSAEVDAAATLDLLASILQAHPELCDVEADQLHAWQEARHHEWAASFNAFLRSRGKEGDIPLEWPL